jgi:RHS repeat-associated protein
LFDPFGGSLLAVGVLAEANVYRFSSKEVHPNSGLIYFLYRFHSPDSQRWMNRDPIEDQAIRLLRIKDGSTFADLNSYRYCANEAENATDAFGLDAPVPLPHEEKVTITLGGPNRTVFQCEVKHQTTRTKPAEPDIFDLCFTTQLLRFAAAVRSNDPSAASLACCKLASCYMLFYR